MPTTGYRWRLLGLPEEIKLDADRFELADNSIGGSGKHHFYLISSHTGTYKFFAELARPWGGEPINRRSITLTIQLNSNRSQK
ncbi:protease inhibitor I42 family protein [Pseudomonas sp. NPDC089569]|uniref:protease inhibitor I42 family protein n=1 Tax=Pseudomonas sp. NPDC089569 TaxID=3390722 RepID=UPI003CFCF4DA